jgi:hypothetical protein
MDINTVYYGRALEAAVVAWILLPQIMHTIKDLQLVRMVAIHKDI